MASPGVIQELLRENFERQNKPDQTLPQIMQIMQGIAQGIAIYDAAKSLPFKYGTPAHQVTTTQPGTPAIPAGPGIGPTMPAQPANAPAPFTLPGIGPEYGTEGLIKPQARTMPGIGPVFPGMPASAPAPFPGAPAGAPTTTTQTIPGQIGTAQAEIMNKLQNFSGPGIDATFKSLLAPLGLEGQISPASGFIYTGTNPDGTPKLVQVPKNTKPDTYGTAQERLQLQKTGIELQEQQLQLSKDKFLQDANQFTVNTQRLEDAALQTRLKEMAQPYLKVLTDKKFAKDADAIQYANNAIKIINDTHQLPNTTYERARAFGIAFPDNYLEMFPEFVVTRRKEASPAKGTKPPAAGMIRVKDKASGKTGSIPEDEFDPELYERIP